MNIGSKQYEKMERCIYLGTNHNYFHEEINVLAPNDHYRSRTAPLTSKRHSLYIYSTNIGTEYFKHGIYSPFFFCLQNAVCFIILMCLVPLLFTFYIQDVLNLKNNSVAKRLRGRVWGSENACRHAVQTLLSASLLCRNVNIKIHRSINFA